MKLLNVSVVLGGYDWVEVGNVSEAAIEGVWIPNGMLDCEVAGTIVGEKLK